jgi:hypothetical protein
MRESLILAATFVIVSATAAQAGGKRFTTPLLSSATNEIFACTVVNADKKPVTVTVRIIGENGVEIPPTNTNCTVPIAPNAVCRVSPPVGSPPAYCDVVSSSAKVRVDLLLLDPLRPGHTAAVVPGTLK